MTTRSLQFHAVNDPFSKGYRWSGCWMSSRSTSSNRTTTSSRPSPTPWTCFPSEDTTSPLAMRLSRSCSLTRQEGQGVTCQKSRNLVVPFEPTPTSSAVLAVAATTTPPAVLAVVAYSCGTGKCPFESL